LQNQLESRISVGATTRKPKKIRLTLSLTNTKRVINGDVLHLNESAIKKFIHVGAMSWRHQFQPLSV
jgi:hypothetical protein